MHQSASVFFYACAAVMVCCLVLGGSTSKGFLSDAVLQLVAAPFLLTCLWRFCDAPLTRSMRWALAFCLAIVLVPLLQLVPLPPRIWTALPHREPVAATFELLERELPWMPISVSPQSTWLSALSLLPPLAIFLGTLLLSYRERRSLSFVVLAVGVVSVFVGLSQVAQGPNSPLRFFEITNPSEAVGFFANRNHFAALLYAMTLFAVAWAVEAAITSELGRQRRDAAWIVAIVASFTVLVVLVAAQSIARSRAGLFLTIVALFGALALALSDRRATSGVTPAKLLAGATTLAIMLAVQYALYRVMQRFTEDPLEDARIAFARTTIAAAKAYMPFGSGMGTFVPVYATFEKPHDALVDTYANRAHNDVLELWLEAGAAGLVLMGLFLAWLVVSAVRVWRRRAPGALDIDQSLARAATLIIALFIAHSFADYPLRTGAVMAMLAFACGLLIEPLAEAESETHLGEERAALALRDAPSPSRPQPAAGGIFGQAPASPPRSGERWGEDVKWPDEWSRDAKDRGRDSKPKPPGSGDPRKD